MHADETQDIHRFLSAGDWFGGLSTTLRELILSRSVVRRFAKGQVISPEDSVPKGLYAVLDGSVYFVREIGSGEEALIHVGEPGFWFGELAILTGNPTAATYLAHTPVRALFLSKAQFDRILAEDARHYQCFARLALQRYGVLIRWFVQIRDLTAEARVRGRLASMANLRRQEQSEPGAVSLAVSQVDLARLVGVSRQTLNAILGKLHQAGLIELGFRRIRVRDAALLADPDAAGAAPAQEFPNSQRGVLREPLRASGERFD
jgi:CRP-like cAMP-binding protein